ncbi:hypothetical protein [Corynebacterium rouxii]|uniref:hypothetical protein n=1 Tax=Corynebacterium rouxii TaxID=2719119 RepID=UPI001E41F035|nr:hypothetical protein [Corynebacterium rouxii]
MNLQTGALSNLRLEQSAASQSPASTTNRLVQKNVTLQCNGDVSTKFAGVTLGTIVYNGKTYYARNYSKVATLNCKV